MPWSLYIIQCSDTSLYTGITTDITRRLKEHNAKKGAFYTKNKTPVKLVYHEGMDSRSEALRREHAIKRLTREEKLELIKGGYAMKVVAFNGSARKNGNTAIMIKHAFKELEKEGIKTELVQLAGEKISGCIACYKCFTAKNKRCVITDDIVNECIKKMEQADGIILGSPTYFTDCTAGMKALIERAGFVSRANGEMFKRKIGAAVVTVRRAGAIHTFDTLNHFFTIGQMITVGSSYWNIGVGRDIGEVKKDEEGLLTMSVLGKNMVWLMKKVYEKRT